MVRNKNPHVTAHLMFILLFWGGLFTPLKSQTDLTLREAIEIGIKNNFQIQILQANEQIAENNNNPANAELLPTVSTTGSYSFSSNNTDQQFFNGDSRSASGAGSRNARASVDASWMIFDGFRREALQEELQLEIERTSEETKAEILSLVEQINIAYYQIGQIQEQISLTNRSIDLNLAILDLALQKQRIGTGSESEVLQARSQLNSDSILLIEQQGDLKSAKNSLNRIINQPLDIDISVVDTVILDVLPNKEVMIQEALSRNPDLILAKLDQLNTAVQIKSIKSVLYPKLSLGASYVYNFSKAEVGFLLSNQTYGPSTQLTLNYDIFSGRNLKKELQNVDLIQGNLVKNQQRISWEIESQISEYYINYYNLADLRGAESRNIEIAEKNSLLANELYRQGRITSFEVREAVLREIQARNRMVLNTYQMKFIEIQLKAIAGILDT